MHRKLSAAQIEQVCFEALFKGEPPSVRNIMAELRQRFGAGGRTERVAEILRSVTEQNPRPSNVGSADVASLLKRLSEAESRAARAEEFERRHQDFWAARYQAKLSEMTRGAGGVTSSGVSFEDYQQLYGKAVELARRLAHYEEVKPLMESIEPTGPPPGTTP